MSGDDGITNDVPGQQVRIDHAAMAFSNFSEKNTSDATACSMNWGQ